MRKDSAHARNHDLSAAAEILANGTYLKIGTSVKTSSEDFCYVERVKSENPAHALKAYEAWWYSSTHS
jgi:hypothetical protein